MREIRNQIVHEGSEANTLKPLGDILTTGDEKGHLDVWFSEKYPEYVLHTRDGLRTGTRLYHRFACLGRL